MLIGPILRMSQPWYVQKLALGLLAPTEAATSVEEVRISRSLQTPSTMKPPDSSKQHTSFHTIVVFVLSAIQPISGFGLVVIHGCDSAVQRSSMSTSITFLATDDYPKYHLSSTYPPNNDENLRNMPHEIPDLSHRADPPQARPSLISTNVTRLRRSPTHLLFSLHFSCHS